MIKYIEHPDSIQDRETGAFIPKSPGNRHYYEYLQWVSEGNKPLTEPPGPDFELIEDTWVENAEKKAERELAEAEAATEVKTSMLLPLLIEMLKGMIAHDLIDLTPETDALFTELRAKVDAVKAKRAK